MKIPLTQSDINAPRDEQHPTCLAQGIELTKQTGGGVHVSGHEWEHISGGIVDGENREVIKCKVCGWVSGPGFEGYEHELQGKL